MKKGLVMFLVLAAVGYAGRVSASSYSTCYLSGSAATSTVVTLATTTTSEYAPVQMVCPVEKGNNFNYGMLAYPASASSKLNWKLELAWDDTCTTTSNCLWFGEDNLSANSNESITHSAYAPIHDWTPATTTPVTKIPVFTPTDGRWVRISYWVTGGSMNLWAVGLTRHEN